MNNRGLEKFAARTASVLGTSWAFLFACIVFILWLVIDGFDKAVRDPGEFITAATGLFVFTQLFIIQRNTNKEIKALHLKLDELIATIDGANNGLIKAEKSPEHVLNDLHDAYSDLAGKAEHPTKPLSINPTIAKRRA